VVCVSCSPVWLAEPVGARGGKSAAELISIVGGGGGGAAFSLRPRPPDPLAPLLSPCLRLEPAPVVLVCPLGLFLLAP
jgi:hypothetical protein